MIRFSLFWIHFFSFSLWANPILLPDSFTFNSLEDINQQHIISIPIKNGEPHKVKLGLLGLYPKLLISVSPNEHSLLIRGDRNQQSELIRVVNLLDQPLLQHQVSLKIIELSDLKLNRLSSGLAVLSQRLTTVYSFDEDTLDLDDTLEGLW